MINLNNKEEVKRIKQIKEYPGWVDYVEFVETYIKELSDIEKIQGEIQLEANKNAIKVIKEILYIINN